MDSDVDLEGFDSPEGESKSGIRFGVPEWNRQRVLVKIALGYA
jgi:hypothetical protein